MICSVDRSVLSGVVRCPPSKSYTHRAVFLAALAGRGSKVEGMLYSEDTDATIQACRMLGARFDTNDASLTVQVPIPIREANVHGQGSSGDGSGDNGDNNCGDNSSNCSNASDTTDIHIDAANSGTTIRIAAGIASLMRRRVTLTGDASLRTRPMQPLLDALSSMGAECSSTDAGSPPVSIRGPISGGEITIPGNLSSQFITSLFLCAPLTNTGIGITVSGSMVSRPYLDATISAMREFGASVQTMIPYRRYRIAPQQLIPATFVVPSDSSSLALLLAAAALNGKDMTVEANMGQLPQGDEAFIDILEGMGTRVEITTRGDADAADPTEDDPSDSTDRKDSLHAGETIHVRPGRLSGGRFDLSSSPDLLPPLAVLALGSSEPVEITNVGHARLKETDRIAVLARELCKIGVKVDEKEDGLTLDATDPQLLCGTTLNPENDHRLFMAFCIAGMRVGRCVVANPDSIRVSYPDFIADMVELGAKMQIGDGQDVVSS